MNPLSRFHPVPGIETEAVLHLLEDVQLTVDEVEFGMEAWQAFPDRLVGFVGHSHAWDEGSLKWTYNSSPSNEFSLVLTGAVFFHRYFSHALTHSLPQPCSHIATTEPDCADLVLNFFISHITRKPPIKATHKQTLVATTTTDDTFVQRQIPCLNLLVTAFGYMPLKYSAVRLDPVLFKDSVSMLRKEYRTLDGL
jgi:glucuronyl/N-acetylglucosaminyl transferase EXT1